MRTAYESTPTLEETLTLETGEEFLLHMHALQFLEDNIDRPDIRDWRRLESEQHGDFASSTWLHDRCAELRDDLRAGWSRLRRGYGGMKFNDADKGILEHAVAQVIKVEEDMPGTDMAKRYAHLVPVAAAVLDHMVEFGFQDAVAAEAAVPKR